MNYESNLAAIFDLLFMLQFRSKMRDLAEKKYGKIPTGDSKPNSWTLLDFGKFLNENPVASVYMKLTQQGNITKKQRKENKFHSYERIHILNCV